MRTRLVALGAVLALVGGPNRAMAGFATATLTASPNNIAEGSGTNLTLTLQHTPYTYSMGYAYYTGSGYMGGVNGAFSPGNPGGSSQLFSVYSGSNYFSTSKLFNYANAGAYPASVSGSIQTFDYIIYNSPYNYLSGYYSSGASFSASTNVNVGNLLPSITSLEWDAIVNIGDTVHFTALATDQGLGAPGSLPLSYEFDLNEDGVYDTAQSGYSSVSGTHSFAAAGIHTIKVRVKDNEGGEAFGQFDVNVLDTAPELSPVPAPPGLVLMATGAVPLLGWRLRRWKRVGE